MEVGDIEGREGVEGGENDISIRMALYSHSRALMTLANLAPFPVWKNTDTSSFDCMHYDGDTALERCASKLSLRPSQHILDIGSGYSHTGRFFATRYHVKVTGIELQREVHELAQAITARNIEPRVVKDVTSVNADFLTLDPQTLGEKEASFDHVVSFLCIVHIPQASRQLLLRQAARYLKPNGRLYIEDFFARNQPTAAERSQLDGIMACSYLPDAAEWVHDLEAAGFGEVEFEDVSTEWTSLVVERATNYKADGEGDKDLERFYDTVAGFFTGGNVGGVRLIAVKK